MGKNSRKEMPVDKASESELNQCYAEMKTSINSERRENEKFNFDRLDTIFEIASKNRKLFPGANMGKNPTLEKYMNHWVLCYCKDIENPASGKKANPKTSCSDPVVRAMIKQVKQIEDKVIDAEEKAHIIFMSAENVLGNLLEEYIANKIQPYGWIWCAGQTLNAIDFCNSKGNALLQIKNKSNSENSSAGKVRDGTIIRKWFRLGTSRKEGKLLPVYHWDELNEIINEYATKNVDENGNLLKKCDMSEKEFQEFIKDVIKKNPEIITEK
jgi:hypothetical protein